MRTTALFRARPFRRPLIATIAAAALLPLAAALPSPPAGAATSTATGTAASCGGSTPMKPDGSAWVCTFDDEFDGSSLNRTKWTVQTTKASGFHSGIECFVDSPSNIAVSNGTLKLTARKASAPFTCASPTGGYRTQYTSGTVNGWRKFAQTYGRFEVRAKLPATTVRGLQETLWLWPVDDTRFGRWPASGEIDFGEFYSRYAEWNIPFLHYHLRQSSVNLSTNTNVYTALPGANAQPGTHCAIDRSSFNVYTVVWRPGRILLEVNHRTCILNNYSASNVADPAPFNHPFFMALTQALGVGDNAFVPGTTPLPATTTVDYVRIWK